MTEDIKDSVQASISFHNNDTAKFKLLWTIKEYTKLKQSVKHPRYIKTKSHVFPGAFSCEIRLYPNGDAMCAEKDHTSSISILNSGKFDDSAWFSYKLALMDISGKEEHVKCAEPTRFYRGSLERISEWFHSEVPRLKLKRLFPNDSIQIVLEGMVWAKEPVDKSKSTSDFIDSTVTSQVALYRDEKFSDVTLSVGKGKFQVHKRIWCSKSSVFLEMLFEKSSRNIIVIPDIREEVFREVVNFIYTDTVTAMFDTMHTEVLIAAKKYELNYLAGICEIRMIRNLCIDNCLEYLQTADKCGTRKLKEKSLEYIKEYRSYVCGTQQWKDFRSEESKLLLELLDNFMNDIGGLLIAPKKKKAIRMLDSESE